jgi:hypothetical protein
MARKSKKSKKSSSTKRRRVSGGNYSVGYMIVGTVAGLFGGTMLSEKVLPTTKRAIKGGVLTAGGGYLAYKAKHPFLTGLGIGVSVAGVAQVGKGFGIIAGMSPRLSYGMQSRLNGRNGISNQVNGRDGIQRQLNGRNGISNQVNGNKHRAMQYADAA